MSDAALSRMPQSYSSGAHVTKPQHIFDDRGQRDAEAETEAARCAVSPDCSRVLFGSEMPWGVQRTAAADGSGGSPAPPPLRTASAGARWIRTQIELPSMPAAQGQRGRGQSIARSTWVMHQLIFHSCFWVRYMLGRDRRLWTYAMVCTHLERHRRNAACWRPYMPGGRLPGRSAQVGIQTHREAPTQKTRPRTRMAAALSPLARPGPRTTSSASATPCGREPQQLTRESRSRA